MTKRQKALSARYQKRKKKLTSGQADKLAVATTTGRVWGIRRSLGIGYARRDR